MSPNLQLEDPELLRDKAYVNGAWIAPDSEALFDVRNPATGEVLARVPDLGAAETRDAILAAQAALPAWRARTAKDRATVLRRWHDLVLAHREDLARLMTAEQGKPLAEARGEVLYGASFLEWFAEEAKRVYGETIPTHQGDKRLLVLKQPVGVFAAITPWNFPHAMITRKVAPGLAAGCTAVIKPAPETPLSALALAELAQRAGVPEGVLNIVTTCRAQEVGLEMTSSPIVRKLSFTGSTAVGKLLMRQSADTVKKLSLELGGNAPFLVFDDADLDAAIQGAMASKYRNSGQTCVCANRFLVQAGIHDAFTERFLEVASSLKLGAGAEEGIQVGPLITERALQDVDWLVQSAVASGAKAALGGARSELGGSFFEPTILTGVTPEMEITQQEIFGPVAPILRFETEAEGVRLANETPYGLASYFFSRDPGRIWRVAEALDFGMVGINEGILSTEVAPFGGIKESGLGREGARQGIEEFLETKYLCWGGLGEI